MNGHAVAVVSFILIIISSILLMYFIFQLVELDTVSRGMPNPKFWSFIAASGQRGEGLLLYFFKRKKYVKRMNAVNRRKAERIKKKIFLVMGCSVAAFIFFILSFLT